MWIYIFLPQITDRFVLQIYCNIAMSKRWKKHLWFISGPRCISTNMLKSIIPQYFTCKKKSATLFSRSKCVKKLSEKSEDFSAIKDGQLDRSWKSLQVNHISTFYRLMCSGQLNKIFSKKKSLVCTVKAYKHITVTNI